MSGSGNTAAVTIHAIIATVNTYPKRKRFNIHNAYHLSGGYLIPVFSDYSPRKVIAWFRQAGATVAEVWAGENGAGVTEFYVEAQK